MKQLFIILVLSLPFCAYSQLSETFDGPEITTTHPWQGDLDRFIINTNKELQLYARESKSQVLLHIATVNLGRNEWSFSFRNETACSSQNYAKVFLWSRKPDIDNPGEAIYVRLGYTKKNIALCYQTGNLKPEVLLEGRMLFDTANEVDIKVVTDTEGNCTIYSQTTSEDSSYKEGTAELPYTDSSGYFMLGLHYTNAHSRNRFFDNISILRFQPEEDAPVENEKAARLIHVEQENNVTLYTYFDKPIIADYASFSLSDLGEVAEIESSDDDQVLRLTWENPMEQGKAYTLSYQYLLDYWGNESSGIHKFTATYENTSPPTTEEPEPPQPPILPGSEKIRINEIMADPKGLSSFPETEYIELYNCTEQGISLTGWQLLYGTTAVPLGNLSLPGKGYVVLFREGRDIHIDTGGTAMPLTKFPAQLANAGKELALIDPSGKIIDKLVYEKAKPGISWERDEKGCFLSTDPRGGTPGSVNSKQSEKPKPEVEKIEPFAIIFNELLPNPFTGGSEYIELYNRSDKTLPLTGLLITTRKSDGTFGTLYPLKSIHSPLPPGGYALLTREKEGVFSFYTTPFPANIHELKIPVLANTSSHLVLVQASDQIVIDEIQYSSKWHAPAIKEQKGVALERIDPDTQTQNKENWISATTSVGYGTPGYQNSQYGSLDGGNPTNIEAPIYSEQTGEYTIAYWLNQPGYNCRAWVYNLSGIRVAEIANHELLSNRGELTWNGTTSNGSSLKPGPYILYIELYHLNGQRKYFKKVFLVH